MFKNTIMAIAIIGLTAGSSQAEHAGMSQERMTKYINKMRNALCDEMQPHALAAAIAGMIACGALSCAALEAFCFGTDYALLQNCVKTFLISGAITGYSAFQLSNANKKIKALNGMQEELEKAVASKF